MLARGNGVGVSSPALPPRVRRPGVPCKTRRRARTDHPPPGHYPAASKRSIFLHDGTVTLPKVSLKVISARPVLSRTTPESVRMRSLLGRSNDNQIKVLPYGHAHGGTTRGGHPHDIDSARGRASAIHGALGGQRALLRGDYPEREPGIAHDADGARGPARPAQYRRLGPAAVPPVSTGQKSRPHSTSSIRMRSRPRRQ